MSKTFKANPTTDKHNLRKRILEIESNPTTTTTTTSTVTKITSGDVGNGLVVDSSSKLNLDLGEGLTSTSGKVDITVGDGLEINSGKVKVKLDGEIYDGHLEHNLQWGILVSSNVLTASHFNSITWGNTLGKTTAGKIDVKDNSIKPVKLDIANEAMFRAMCVNRTVWVEFANASLTPSVAMGIQFFGNYQSIGISDYDNPQFSIETFNYNGSTALVWYRIHLRGMIKKSSTWVNNDVMANIRNPIYEPKKISARRLPLYDSDGSSDYYTDIEMSLYDGKLAISRILSASGSLQPNSNIDLAGVSWDTLPTA